MEYSFIKHTLSGHDPADNPQIRPWLAAVELGFHHPSPPERFVAHELQVESQNDVTLRGAFAAAAPPHALPTTQPVATFTEWEGSLNIGGSLLPVHQISDVTVRPAHRRRGLLRRLMTDSLTEAKERGLAMSALTATEATIYGRFGFGPAVFTENIELSCSPGFHLTTPLPGVVDHLDPTDLIDVTGAVFHAFHSQQAGSIARGPAQHEVLIGALEHRTREEASGLRAAAHWDEDQKIDGYVTWSVNDSGDTATVIDMVGTTERAQLSLWEFLGSLDLIKKVRARNVPTDTPLPWALADRRWYRVNASNDSLWLRILDPVAVLTARDYMHEGSVSIRVVDDLGLADGEWRIDVANGRAAVTPIAEGTADVELEVSALSSTVLDGVRVSALEAAGLIRGDLRRIDVLESLLARRRAPWCATFF